MYYYKMSMCKQLIVYLSGYSIRGYGTLKVSKTMWRYRVTGALINCFAILRLLVLPWYLTGTVNVGY